MNIKLFLVSRWPFLFRRFVEHGDAVFFELDYPENIGIAVGMSRLVYDVYEMIYFGFYVVTSRETRRCPGVQTTNDCSCSLYI
jgi:hypothetical protein